MPVIQVKRGGVAAGALGFAKEDIFTAHFVRCRLRAVQPAGRGVQLWRRWPAADAGAPDRESPLCTDLLWRQRRKPFPREAALQPSSRTPGYPACPSTS